VVKLLDYIGRLIVELLRLINSEYVCIVDCWLQQWKCYTKQRGQQWWADWQTGCVYTSTYR